MTATCAVAVAATTDFFKKGDNVKANVKVDFPEGWLEMEVKEDEKGKQQFCLMSHCESEDDGIVEIYLRGTIEHLKLVHSQLSRLIDFADGE